MTFYLRHYDIIYDVHNTPYWIMKLVAHIKIDVAFFLDAEVMGWLADRDNGLGT